MKCSYSLHLNVELNDLTYTMGLISHSDVVMESLQCLIESKGLTNNTIVFGDPLTSAPVWWAKETPIFPRRCRSSLHDRLPWTNCRGYGPTITLTISWTSILYLDCGCHRLPRSTDDLFFWPIMICFREWESYSRCIRSCGIHLFLKSVILQIVELDIGVEDIRVNSKQIIMIFILNRMDEIKKSNGTIGDDNLIVIVIFRLNSSSIFGLYIHNGRSIAMVIERALIIIVLLKQNNVKINNKWNLQQFFFKYQCRFIIEKCTTCWSLLHEYILENILHKVQCTQISMQSYLLGITTGRKWNTWVTIMTRVVDMES